MAIIPFRSRWQISHDEYEAQPYSIELWHEDESGIEMVLARESSIDMARWLYELMCAQHSGRLVMLCNRARIIARSDRDDGPEK